MFLNPVSVIFFEKYENNWFSAAKWTMIMYFWGYKKAQPSFGIWIKKLDGEEEAEEEEEKE